MRALLLICTGLLLLALVDLPIGYYTLLRIAVTIGAVAVVVAEFENGLNFWVIAFGLIAIIFNPLIPIYFGDKSTWMPIDLITAVLFAIKSFINQNNKNNE
jgi:hypothetical protein